MVGAVTIVINVVISIIRFPITSVNAPWKVYFVALSLPAFGLSVGYSVPKILRMDSVYARTVAIETAVQNFPLCFAVIILSFPRRYLVKIAFLPFVSALGVIICCTMLVLFYKLVKKIKKRKESYNSKNRRTLTNGDAEQAVELKLISEDVNPKV